MKEGTEEKDIMKAVHCRGFNKLLKIEDCNMTNCPEHFGGIKKEPIFRREDGEKEKKVVGHNEFVICKFPKLLSVHTICEV